MCARMQNIDDAALSKGEGDADEDAVDVQLKEDTVSTSADPCVRRCDLVFARTFGKLE